MNKPPLFIIVFGVALMLLPIMIRPLPIEDDEYLDAHIGSTASEIEKISASIDLFMRENDVDEVELENVRQHMNALRNHINNVRNARQGRLIKYPSHIILGLIFVMVGFIYNRGKWGCKS